MNVAVGSMNPVKIAAVESVLRRRVPEVDARGHAAPSDVSSQPTTLEETIQGAINRASWIRRDAMAKNEKLDLIVGIESGVFRVAPSRSERRLTLDACACVALWPDGPTDGMFWIMKVGLSPAWQVPPLVAQAVYGGYGDPCDVDEAFLRCELTTNPRLGKGEGAIGLLTRGRVTRQSCTESAIEMALIGWEPLAVSSPA